MSAQTIGGQCIALRSAQTMDLPEVLDLLGRSGLPSAGVADALPHYFPRFGFACVSRDSVAEAVKVSAEFKEACPASATVMRKKLAS